MMTTDSDVEKLKQGARWIYFIYFFYCCCWLGVFFFFRLFSFFFEKKGVAATLANVVEQFTPESEQPLDVCFLEDPKANLRAIVMFTMRGVGLLFAYTRDPSWVRAMSVDDLEVLVFLCGDDCVLSPVQGADDAAKAAESTITSRCRRDPPDLGEIRAALQAALQ
jgi:hypothetical protein